MMIMMRQSRKGQSLLSFIFASIALMLLAVGILRIWTWFNANYGRKAVLYQRSRLMAAQPNTYFKPVGIDSFTDVTANDQVYVDIAANKTSMARWWDTSQYYKPLDLSEEWVFSGQAQGMAPDISSPFLMGDPAELCRNWCIMGTPIMTGDKRVIPANQLDSALTTEQQSKLCNTHIGLDTAKWCNGTWNQTDPVTGLPVGYNVGCDDFNMQCPPYKDCFYRCLCRLRMHTSMVSYEKKIAEICGGDWQYDPLCSNESCTHCSDDGKTGDHSDEESFEVEYTCNSTYCNDDGSAPEGGGGGAPCCPDTKSDDVCGCDILYPTYEAKATANLTYKACLNDCESCRGEFNKTCDFVRNTYEAKKVEYRRCCQDAAKATAADASEVGFLCCPAKNKNDVCGCPLLYPDCVPAIYDADIAACVAKTAAATTPLTPAECAGKIKCRPELKVKYDACTVACQACQDRYFTAGNPNCGSGVCDGPACVPAGLPADIAQNKTQLENCLYLEGNAHPFKRCQNEYDAQKEHARHLQDVKTACKECDINFPRYETVQQADGRILIEGSKRWQACRLRTCTQMFKDPVEVDVCQSVLGNLTDRLSWYQTLSPGEKALVNVNDALKSALNYNVNCFVEAASEGIDPYSPGFSCAALNCQANPLAVGCRYCTCVARKWAAYEGRGIPYCKVAMLRMGCWNQCAGCDPASSGGLFDLDILPDPNAPGNEGRCKDCAKCFVEALCFNECQRCQHCGSAAACAALPFDANCTTDNCTCTSNPNLALSQCAACNEPEMFNSSSTVFDNIAGPCGKCRNCQLYNPNSPGKTQCGEVCELETSKKTLQNQAANAGWWGNWGKSAEEYQKAADEVATKQIAAAADGMDAAENRKALLDCCINLKEYIRMIADSKGHPTEEYLCEDAICSDPRANLERATNATLQARWDASYCDTCTTFEELQTMCINLVKGNCTAIIGGPRDSVQQKLDAVVLQLAGVEARLSAISTALGPAAGDSCPERAASKADTTLRAYCTGQCYAAHALFDCSSDTPPVVPADLVNYTACRNDCNAAYAPAVDVSADPCYSASYDSIVDTEREQCCKSLCCSWQRAPDGSGYVTSCCRLGIDTGCTCTGATGVGLPAEGRSCYLTTGCDRVGCDAANATTQNLCCNVGSVYYDLATDSCTQVCGLTGAQALGNEQRDLLTALQTALTTMRNNLPGCCCDDAAADPYNCPADHIPSKMSMIQCIAENSTVR